MPQRLEISSLPEEERCRVDRLAKMMNLSEKTIRRSIDDFLKALDKNPETESINFGLPPIKVVYRGKRRFFSFNVRDAREFIFKHPEFCGITDLPEPKKLTSTRLAERTNPFDRSIAGKILRLVEAGCTKEEIVEAIGTEEEFNLIFPVFIREICGVFKWRYEDGVIYLEDK